MKTSELKIRLSDGEKLLLVERASSCGLSVSAYVRNWINGGEGFVGTKEEDVGTKEEDVGTKEEDVGTNELSLSSVREFCGRDFGVQFSDEEISYLIEEAKGIASYVGCEVDFKAREFYIVEDGVRRILGKWSKG